MIDSILIALQLPNYDIKSLEEELNEMTLLANTLGYNINDIIVQKRIKIDPSTYFGKGKIESIINQCKEIKCKNIFINDELSPSHFKNIQMLCKKKINIYDRTQLILDIFSSHAKTKESRTQIDLARLEYLLPRLTGMWTHLERQAGGTGTRGGPGEKQIEIDRRLANRDITKLKKELNKIEIQRNTQRKSRKNTFKIALVGYTNAGKSSLLKAISGHDAYIKNQLFATLDTTTKKVKINKTDVLLSDTVGFLRKLPHNLIASFRSTLADIEDADLIIKIIDISSTDINGHIQTIELTLKELECDKKKSILVFNKIDKIKDSKKFTQINKTFNNPLMISTINKLKINNLIDAIDDIINANQKKHRLKVKQRDYKTINEIYKRGRKVKEKSDFENISFNFYCDDKDYDIIKNIRKSSFSEDF